MPEQPNVLILMNDQHHPEISGYAGDDIVRTPTLDWLADSGTVFTNAYTPAPVCVPARHSIRTGQLPRTWARSGFSSFESPEYKTLPTQLARHGYMTASGGKEHYPGWNQQQGWRKRIGPTPMKQHGISDEHVPDPASNAETRSLDDWKWTGTEELVRAGVSDSRVQVQDRRVTEGVEQYIREFFSSPYYDRAQPGTPLCLKTSLIEPHYPYFTSDEDLFTYYLNRVEPLVEEPSNLHPYISGAQTAGECRIAIPGESVSERHIRRATASYYAMIETVDELFGRVLDALRRNGEDLDEWVIVFTSDHGEMLGERGMWGKGQFLESSACVPMIIRYPDRFDPGTVEENVNLCDIYATICDIVDVPVPESRDSRSLVPLMENDTHDWTNETVSQGVGNDSVVNGVESSELMIKRNALKYCYFGEEYDEVLFDLERDPDESTNFADDPEYSDAIEQFRSRRSELGYGPNGESAYENASY